MYLTLINLPARDVLATSVIVPAGLSVALAIGTTTESVLLYISNPFTKSSSTTTSSFKVTTTSVGAAADISIVET